MKIILKNINEIIPYENNPRINDGAVDIVASSIKEFGFKVPIIIDKDNIIVAGHTRIKAADKLGLKQIPCIMADDLTPAQIKGLRIADNQTHTFSIWDYPLLNLELDKLKEMEFDFDFGFGDDIDFDNIKSNENRETNDNTKTIECPNCGHKIEI